MPSYLHPGVYVEEIPSGSKPIEAVGTSTAAFIGYIERGSLAEPTMVTSWEEYERDYGGIRDAGDDEGDLMGLSVSAYFQNGGGKAYIIRIASGSPAKATGNLTTTEGGATAAISFQAINEGTWANDLVVKITARDKTDENNDRFDLEVGFGTGDDFVSEEVFLVTLTDGDNDYIESTVNDGSNLVRVTGVPNAAAARTRINSAEGSDEDSTADDAIVEVTFSSGTNGGAPDAENYSDVFSALVKYRDVNMILLPDQVWDEDGQPIIEQAVAHCEHMKNRMVIFDLPSDEELESEKEVTDLNLTTSTYAATYYPWALVRNPFYNADTNRGAARLLPVPAAPFAAGQWARTDARRGVWKAPAGVESNLLGISKLAFTVEDAEQDYLNPLGVNALRRLPNYGSVIWGTRTRSTKANPEWRYIPVRRTAMFIEESIFNGIHWAVFEPNDHRLWSSLRTNIESFMSGLHRSGAFQGEKASDAYFVRCGLGQTMTQGDIDRGQVIVQVGFAPLKPAEFVIVRIQQKVGQQ